MLGRLIAGAAIIGGGLFLYRQKLGFFEPETRSSLRKALVAERRGDVQEAEERFHDALHASVDSHGNHSEQSLSILLRMGQFFREHGQHQEALNIYLYLASLCSQGKHFSDPKKPAEIYMAAAGCLQEMGRYEGAERFLGEALKRADSEQKGPILEALGAACFGAEAYPQAIQYYQQALHLCQQQLGPHAPECTAIQASLQTVQDAHSASNT